MGKSEDQLKTKTKTIQKSPISMFWMGTSLAFPNLPVMLCARSELTFDVV
jgi:hypothetical protein